MKNLMKALMAATASLFLAAQVSASIHKRDKHSYNNDEKTNFYVGRLTSTSRFYYDEAALYLIGELGPKQNRVDGAISYEICPYNGLKIGGGMLNQELKFFFPHFSKEHWVSQYYGGGAYQFDIGRYCFESFEIAGGYSCAPSRCFQKNSPVDHNHRGNKKHNNTSSLYKGRIAGSRYAFGSIGTTFVPFQTTTIWAAATYDHLIYDLKYCQQEIVEGFGGAFRLTQRLAPCLFFDFLGEFRKPYSYYEGRLMYSEILCDCDVVMGVFAGHTNGRYGMPSSSIVGLEIGFDFGFTNYSNVSSVSLCPRPNTPLTMYGTESFARWSAKPAFYIPQVIAKKDCVVQ